MIQLEIWGGDIFNSSFHHSGLFQLFSGWLFFLFLFCFNFHMNLIFFNFYEEFCWNFGGDCIESVNWFWQENFIFTIGNLPILEHGWPFHLLVSSSISFFCVLKILFLNSRMFPEDNNIYQLTMFLWLLAPLYVGRLSIFICRKAIYFHVFSLYHGILLKNL